MVIKLALSEVNPSLEGFEMLNRKSSYSFKRKWIILTYLILNEDVDGLGFFLNPT